MRTARYINTLTFTFTFRDEEIKDLAIAQEEVLVK